MSIRFKPQNPTFTDPDSTSDPTTDTSKYTPEKSANKEEGQSPQQQQQLPKNKPPPISSINIDEFLTTGLKELKSINDITSMQSLALFQRLVEDILQLTAAVKSDPSINIAHILFKDIYMNMKIDDLPTILKPQIPRNPVSPISQLTAASHSQISLSNFSKDTAEDLEIQLEIPLKKCSKIHSNFEDIPTLEDSSSSIPIFESDSQTSSTSLSDTAAPNTIQTSIFDDYDRRYDQTICDPSLKSQLMKRFYLRQPPVLTVTAYLERINQYASPSAAVLLCAAFYLFNTVFNLKPVEKASLLPYRCPIKATDKEKDTPMKDDTDSIEEEEEEDATVSMQSVEDLNVFRLILTVLRVSFKLIEDKNFKQGYYCKITGLQNVNELFKMELSLLYLLDFNLFINQFNLTRFLFQFQQFDTNLKNTLKDAEH